MTNEVKKCITLMFPEDAQDRTQRILKRLRNDNDKDHHCAGSLTYIGRCAVDHAAADLIESLSAQLEQVTRERDAAIKYIDKNCETCAHLGDGEYVSNDCMDCMRNCNWQWRGVEVKK